MRFAMLLLMMGGLALGQLAEVKNAPAYPGSVLFVSNLQGGDENGFAKVMEKPEGSFKCGREPYAVEVGWKFLERSPKGDVYELTQSSPAGTEAKKVVYNNEAIAVWKDSGRTVIVKPKEP